MALGCAACERHTFALVPWSSRRSASAGHGHRETWSAGQMRSHWWHVANDADSVKPWPRQTGQTGQAMPQRDPSSVRITASSYRRAAPSRAGRCAAASSVATRPKARAFRGGCTPTRVGAGRDPNRATGQHRLVASGAPAFVRCPDRRLLLGLGLKELARFACVSSSSKRMASVRGFISKRLPRSGAWAPGIFPRLCGGRLPSDRAFRRGHGPLRTTSARGRRSRSS